jgi:hypothetical protein
MEIGEEDLIAAQAQAAVFLGDGLFDLQDQVGPGPDVIDVGHDLGPGADEVGVGHGRTLAGIGFDENGVAGRGELPDAGRGDGHPVLVLFPFLRHADDHGMRPYREFRDV